MRRASMPSTEWAPVSSKSRSRFTELLRAPSVIDFEFKFDLMDYLAAAESVCAIAR